MLWVTPIYITLTYGWLSSNKLSLNINKTKYITFQNSGNRPVLSQPELVLRNKQLTKVSSTKFLGLTISENLSWKSHMLILLKKIRVICGSIKKIQHFINVHTLKLLYHSMIQSQLYYCIITWCHNNKGIQVKLQKVL